MVGGTPAAALTGEGGFAIDAQLSAFVPTAEVDDAVGYLRGARA